MPRKMASGNGNFRKTTLSQIDDAEYIRDHMFRAIYGSFYNYKHPTVQMPNTDQGKIGKFDNSKQQQKADSLQLKWVSYLLGKRESRRLVGDYIYTFNDERTSKQFEDAVVFEKREVDVHYQVNLVDQDKPNFLSEAMFYKTEQYNIPYRCFYSKNISNLFMAGRDFSCSHVGLGGPRVMRTTGQMGAAVGIAASVCKKYNVTPREVYQSHLKRIPQFDRITEITMRTFCYSIFLMFCLLPFLFAATNQPDGQVTCRKAFVYKTDEFAVANPINVCLKNNVPVGYQATLNMAVCDDKLCANVFLKMDWDLAGSFVGFDTLPGKPLTKFDHKRFTDADYKKLDQILKDRNSMLRVLSKNELVDKSVVVKSATV